ncbi:nuclear protein export protein Yrb2 [Myxozyma melibiosi]|uniref:Protein YIP n=1 Tax=Myxozyma melibiosi TaxID=54550 RepID=A0ABR1FBA4_9ASCO
MSSDQTIEVDVPLNDISSSKGSSTPVPPPYTPTSNAFVPSSSTAPPASSASAPSSSTALPPLPGLGAAQNARSVGGDQIQDRRFAGGDTLDEPVLETLMRDVRAVGRRVKQVLHPKVNANVDVETGQIVRDWDLWGPLVFCLFVSLFLSIAAPANQSTAVFSGVFAFIWIAEAFVTLNMKLLGGSISFFHAVCILGYALFPLVPASIFALAVKSMIIRLPIAIALVAWSLFASMRTLKGAGVREGRVVLAMYPVWLFYGWLGWLCVIT